MKRSIVRPIPQSSLKGQGLVEYSLILVLVAVVVIGILALLGPNIRKSFGDVTCSTKYATSAEYANEGVAKGNGSYKNVYFDPQSAKPADCYSIDDPKNKGNGNETYSKLGPP